MNTLVQKYGGTSVGNAERIIAVANRVLQTRQSVPRLVVVVSAMGDSTDDLLRLAKQVSRNPHPREIDQLISTGENISAALLTMAIQDLGADAISLTGGQAGIYTENTYSKAKITEVNPKRVLDELDKGKVVIVTGFQGINDEDDITTIGRGGSDTSAVVLAAAIGARECEIYTDVDGVYTTDPRLIPNARKLTTISYDEMLEMASLGAKVLHPRSVECAKENDIILHVRSSFQPNEGTRVKEESSMEVTRPVTGITLNDEEAKISILKVPDQPGIAGRVFSRLAAVNINVDMIIQSVEENHINTITFTVASSDLDQAVAITSEVAQELGAEGIKTDSDIAKVSLVGVGMISKPGIAARTFSVLGQAGINIKLISTSEIKISCVVEKKDAQKAVSLLHQEFELDKA